MSNNQCSHPVVINGICTTCSSQIDQKLLDTNYVRADPNNSIVMISFEEAKRKNLEEEQRLIDAKKLSLVIDLDKTLIDTTEVRNRAEVDAIKKLDPAATEDDFFEFNMNQNLLIRYRPHVRQFLASIAPYFDMQIYTLASPAYAHAILSKIDPEDKLFKNRIFSRTAEDFAMIKEAMRNQTDIVNKKNIKKIFPYSDKLVLVLDDSPEVWFCDNNKLFKGLVQIKRYSYFTRQGPNSPPTVNPDYVNDDILIQMRSVLIDVHDMFYKNYDPEESHVIMTLHQRKAQVFEGKTFYFSGLSEDDTMTFTRLAEEFGALVVDSFTPYTTHIIVGEGGTDDQIQKAMEYRGVYIIYLKWLFECFIQYARIEESLYSIQGIPCPTNGNEDLEDQPAEDVSSGDMDFGFDDPEEKTVTTNVQKLTYDDIKDDPDWMNKVMAMEIDSDEEEDKQGNDDGNEEEESKKE
ncbi:NLI interacting factor-like phosphatase family protein [Trichomonas vaginalis G3]|uniref:protein-serine/threonine phosphatase n=1 Tax=Trichomonas vaginalis (strain ATCC PRA-98 / G3) TaxID=412133 RepID=A2G1J7_TRIV3|nr:RNA polymerase II CTD heptapeptide repeat phosphatase protein [Trichomonas vaginalis G3]EAX88972.1 NLI interacting factor-like phosphatase family protein [Trichomonas vaginalis G3]KAI5533047.1 RNA polymerase II CTD heptapeptide repeat phosphatase protein [Trichomonas vaginalis G3]|eukprot:XP_001301902.1 NLI interacting factor-like phosphatase family protein [Trichomonas vaginalis G3]